MPRSAVNSKGKSGSRAESLDFAGLLPRVQKLIEPRLASLFKERERSAARIEQNVLPMVRAVRSLSLRGGKRLRPALAYVGALSVRSKFDEDLVLDAGVALELLQGYFLIHDDWMDQDDERRGGPTAHVELTRAFGSPHVGAASAILAGDYSLALAIAQFAKLRVPAARAPAALACFADMQVAALYGQQLDLLGRARDPELTYALKTASYTVQGPLQLGALLVGGKPETLKTLESYALPAGVAFQLRDDLIGVFGDPAHTGKPSGGDLIAGKRTFLVQKASELGSAAEKKAVGRVLGNPQATGRDLARALEAIERSGARAATEARISTLAKKAIKAASGPGVSRAGKTLLEQALRALTERTS